MPTPPASSAEPSHPLLLPAALWLAVVAAALVLRPLMPVDETRYLSAAWEMWLHGDLLVPHLNGQTYAHKPPLLFWVIDTVWYFTGVREWTARLVSPLFGLGCLWMIWRLAPLIWPEDGGTARRAPLVLIGTGGFAFYATLAMFDAPLTFLALVGIEGSLRAWRGAVWGWALCGIALALGILMKGPVAALHILPVPVLAPLWMGARPAGGWGRWYAGTLFAFLLGAGLALAWALPAARAGGEAYAAELLWGQTADRMVRAFAHRQPPWWYLPMVPLLLLPWIAVPRLWQGVRRRLDTGDRLCLVWFFAPLLIFSAISGKQAQYLLPELVPLALLAARRLAGLRATPWIAAGTAAALVLAHVVFAVHFAPRYDLNAAAAFLVAAEREGRPLATTPDYEGDFNFLARLTRPIDIIGGKESVPWARDNPHGLLIVTLKEKPGGISSAPVATFPYRDKTLFIWDAAAVVESDGRVMGERY